MTNTSVGKTPTGKTPTLMLFGTLLIGVGALSTATIAQAETAPDFGPNVVIFNPSMTTSQIQATVNAIAAQQISNQFGTQRYTLLFEPGTYGSSTTPLNFQVGYYTEIAWHTMNVLHLPQAQLAGVVSCDQGFGRRV